MTVREGLDRGRFVVTTEVQLPGDESTEEVFDSLRRIQGRVDAVSLTTAGREDEPLEGVVADSLQTCDELRAHFLHPVFRVATRTADRPIIQERLLKAAGSGVQELLVFTEDYRLTGDGLDEQMFFHVDTGKFFSVLEALGDSRGIEGADLPKPVEFCIGSGVDSSRGGRITTLQREELEHMAEQKVDYLLTTPVFDLDVFAKFMDRVAPYRVPVIAEVMTLRSAGMAHYLNRYFRGGTVPKHVIQRISSSNDREGASIEIFSELVAGLRELCQGVHIVPAGVGRGLHRYLDGAGIV